MQPSQEITISYKTIRRVLFVGFLILALFLLKDLLLIFLTSLVIATFVTAASLRLEKRGINRRLAVAGIYILTVLCLVALFYVFAPLIIQDVKDFLIFIQKYLPEGSALLDKVSGANDLTSGGGSAMTGAINEQSIKNFQSIINIVSGGFFDTLTAIFGGIANIALIFILSFYLSMEDRGIEKFLKIIIPFRYEDYIVDLWLRTERNIALWFKGQIFLAFIVGILTYLTLLFIGVPYAALIGILTMIFDLIPYGVTLAFIPAVAFAFLEGGVNMALITLGAYLVIQNLEGYVLQPWIMKKVVGISPIAVIISLLVGFKLGGFWGLVLAVPVSTFVMEYMSDLEKKKIPLRNQHSE